MNTTAWLVSYSAQVQLIRGQPFWSRPNKASNDLQFNFLSLYMVWKSYIVICIVCSTCTWLLTTTTMTPDMLVNILFMMIFIMGFFVSTYQRMKLSEKYIMIDISQIFINLWESTTCFSRTTLENDKKKYYIRLCWLFVLYFRCFCTDS